MNRHYTKVDSQMAKNQKRYLTSLTKRDMQ